MESTSSRAGNSSYLLLKFALGTLLIVLAVAALPAAASAIPQITFVNFQPSTMAVPAENVADTGQIYGNRGNGYSYGWSQSETANTKLRTNTGSTDVRRNSLISTVTTPAATWKIAVPNAEYAVAVIAGDPDAPGPVGWAANGQVAVQGTTTTANKWVNSAALVNVTNGFIELTPLPGTSANAINALQITGFPPSMGVSLPMDLTGFGITTTVNGQTANYTYWMRGNTSPPICTIDGGPMISCDSPDPLDGLSQGAHQILMIASNSFGSTTVVSPFVNDTLAPGGTLSSPQAGTNTSSNVTLNFTTSDATAVTATCSLDGAAPAACTTGKAYTGLASGGHSIMVQLTDAAGNTNNLGTNFTVVSVPTVSISSPTPAQVFANSSSIPVAFNATGESSTVTCKFDSAAAQNCVSGQVYAPMATGNHTLTVTVQNAAGTAVATVAFSVSAPVAVPTARVGTPQLTAADTGGEHTCAYGPTTSECWGENNFNQLGDGYGTNSSYPNRSVQLPTDVTSISAGADSNCVVRTTGTIACWGQNDFGQLGDGTNRDRSAPVQVSGVSSGATAVSVGSDHACAVISGAAKCWGNNNFGQLGNASTTASSAPVQVSGLTTNVASISAGTNTTCAVTTTGAARCWGLGTSGQLGNGGTTSSTTSMQVFGLTTGVAKVSVGQRSSCVVKTNGSASCWGYGAFGTLGNNTTTSVQSTPVTVSSPGTSLANISVGYDHVCAAKTTGAAYCWGSNSYGQLGFSAGTTRIPTLVTGLSAGVSTISAGDNHSCASLTNGLVKCWGANAKGQVGIGTVATSYSPTDVIHILRPTAGAAVIPFTTTNANSTTCQIDAGATSACTGASSINYASPTDASHTATVRATNSLGTATTAWRFRIDSGAPTVAIAAPVATGTTTTTPAVQFTATDTGGSGIATTTCRYGPGTSATGSFTPCSSGDSVAQALLSPGTYTVEVQATDRADNVATAARTFTVGGDLPTVSVGSPNLTKFQAGERNACALTPSGGAQCAGSNSYGQLGTGPKADQAFMADLGNFSSGVASVGGGYRAICVLTTSGGVKCQGGNDKGQLGNGTNTDSSTPVDVVGLTSGVQKLAVGGDSACALLTGGGLKCWGDNTYGALGNGTTTSSNVPVDVAGISSGASAVSVTQVGGCALISGAAKCWGDNRYGAVGNGTTTLTTTPADVTGLSSGVAEIGGAGLNSCARLTDGSVRCWGANYMGQLGDGSLTPSTLPVTPIGLESNVVSLAVGSGHSCALTIVGALKCWGSNSSGQIGRQTSSSSVKTPMTVTGLNGGVLSATAGSSYTCATTIYANALCWGTGGNWSLGTGIGNTYSYPPTPVAQIFSSTSVTPTFTTTNATSATCQLDSASVTPNCTSPQALTGLSQGPHKLTIAATNAAGTTNGVWSFFVDTVAPFGGITSPASGNTYATTPVNTFSATDNAPASGVRATECRNVAGTTPGGTFVSCMSDQPYQLVPGGPLAPGVYTLQVKMTDRAGNVRFMESTYTIS